VLSYVLKELTLVKGKKIVWYSKILIFLIFKTQKHFFRWFYILYWAYPCSYCFEIKKDKDDKDIYFLKIKIKIDWKIVSISVTLIIFFFFYHLQEFDVHCKNKLLLVFGTKHWSIIWSIYSSREIQLKRKKDLVQFAFHLPFISNFFFLTFGLSNISTRTTSMLFPSCLGDGNSKQQMSK
jgi:hypothetical protein